MRAPDEVYAYIDSSPDYPKVAKTLTYKIRQRRLPRQSRSCQFTGDPRPKVFNYPDCSAPCPAEPLLQFLNHCQGAEQLLPAPQFSVASRAAGRGVRITGLEVSGLPTQPPFSEPTIALFCNGRGCPSGARFFGGWRGDSLRIRSFARRALSPGSVVDIWVVKGNFMGRVQRYEVRGRRLAASSLCAHPAKLDPQPCPPG